MKPDQERVKNLIMDTVKLLCRNGLSYNFELKVQGLLGVTLDQSEVFIIHMDEKITCADEPSVLSEAAAAALCQVATESDQVDAVLAKTWLPDVNADAVAAALDAQLLDPQRKDGANKLEDDERDEGHLTIADIDSVEPTEPINCTSDMDAMSQYMVLKSESLTAGVDVVTDVVEEQVVATEEVMAAASEITDKDLVQLMTDRPQLPVVVKTEEKSLHSESMCDSDSNESSSSDDDEMSSEESSPMKQSAFPGRGVSESSQSVVQRFVQDSYMRGGSWPGAASNPCEYYNTTAWRTLPGILSGVVPVGHSSGIAGEQAVTPGTDIKSPSALYHHHKQHSRLPRRPRESDEKRFRCPFCELAYYHKKHLKYHLLKKHGL